MDSNGETYIFSTRIAVVFWQQLVLPSCEIKGFISEDMLRVIRDHI